MRQALRILSQRETSSLEDLVDKTSLSNVLYALSEICMAKAEHLEENWQDSREAKEWERMANRIDTVSVAAQKLEL